MEHQDPNYYHQHVPVGTDEIYANMAQEDRVKNIIAQVSPDSQLYEIEMRIKGYRKNQYTQQWERISPDAPEPHPLLVQRFVSYLSSILNQNTSLSNLTEKNINDIMGLVINYIVDDLSANSEIYGLTRDFTERTRLGHIILNSVFMVLSRALNGQESRRMWNTLSLTENNGMQGGGQKSGLMNALQFWK